MYQISAIPAFNDNYIWAIVNENQCVVVDPGDANVVLKFLSDHQLNLSAIMLTHHHNDHIGGVKTLCESFAEVTVYAPNTNRFPKVTKTCKEGDVFFVAVADSAIEVIEVPGHTSDHIAYCLDDNLFVGDTLFSGGCGRLFEGTAAQMQQSLQKLKKFPEHFKVFCAHNIPKQI